MGFPLEVGVGKKNINGRRHIKYENNVDLKYEADSRDEKISKK